MIRGLCVASVAWVVIWGWARAQDAPQHQPAERDGVATILHKADIVKDRSTNGPGRMKLWPLLSTPEARMNYVEVAGPGSAHFHPDADHRLYVLEGRVKVTCGTNTSIAIPGDLIIIPKGVRHSYDVPSPGERALLLTFDAPPYDPAKTVNVQEVPTRK